MKVLVATDEQQGHHPTDRAECLEGELVAPGADGCADERCGCGRTFHGLASGRTTTTALVVDLPHVSADDLRGALLDRLERSGCAELLLDGAHPDDADAVDVKAALASVLDEQLDELERVCASHPVGTVVERDGRATRARALPAAA